MQLKYVELQGFKSFPDRTVINFGDGVTAIVGPNGSGKSNIADAVRWVMGETSSKTLRGTKMEDVIFDGTAERKPLGFAEVTLVLDNSDKTLDIAYDEIAITRRYFRSGESEYYINRSPVRLRDIQELLRDTGLGKNGYAIIGQGAVTEIIQAKSTARRTLFEEAAGIANFRFKKEESQRKLDQTQDNIVRLNDIITELADRLGPLEEQSKKARKYLALRDEKKDLEITLWVNRTEQLKTVISEAEQKAKLFETDASNAAADLEKTEKTVIETAAEIERITAEIEDLRSGIRALEEEAANRQTEIVVAQNDILHAEKDIERLRADITDRRGEQEKADEERKAHIEEIEKIKVLLPELEERENALKLKISETEASETERYNEIALTEAETEKLNDSLTFFRVRLGSLEQSAENNKKYIEERNSEIADAKERMDSLVSLKATAEEAAAKAREDLASANNVLEGYKAKLNSRTDKADKLRIELEQLRQELSRRSDRLQILSSMEKHYEGFQNSVRTVMDETKRGVLSGVEGTVSDLINVDDEHTVAIETALGNALQNIVTTTEKNAKSIINYLKSRNAGRATFLPLDTVKGQSLRDEDKIADEYGFVGIASDLVKCDGKYSEIIRSLLGKTVITEDLDSAVSIAGKNAYGFKVVSLDGQTVNPGGSLTGGSIAKNIGVLSRHNEIETLKKEINTYTKKVAQAEEDLLRMTEETASVKATLDGAEAEIRVLEQDIIRYDGDIAHYNEYFENMKQQEQLLLRELEQYAKNTETQAAETDIVKANIVETEKAIAEKAEHKLSVQTLLDSVIAIKEGLKADIHAIELEALNITKNLETELAHIQRLDLQDSQRKLGEEKLEEEIFATQTRISALNEKISALETEKEELRKKTEGADTGVAEKAALRAELERQQTINREQEKRFFTLKEQLFRELEKQTSVITNGLAERDSIVAKIWDEYELTFSEAEKCRIEIEDKEEAQRKVNSIKASMRALGDVNLGAIEEFVAVKERYDNLTSQVKDLEDSKIKIEEIIADLTKKMESVFREKFEVINEEFGNVFREMFDGGSAKLTLEDPDNILESGVEIYVAPPGKIIKHLSSLSGGEQALTAIALYFAIMKIRPAPFCLLDEIEAALDDVNVARYAEYINRHTNRQFIVITHRRGTMESAHMLYGVTMKEKGISRIIAIDVNEIESHI